MDLPNTFRRHEVLIEARTSVGQPIHPAATRRPGRANKTDAIKWKDRKILAIENLKSEWEETKGQKKDGESRSGEFRWSPPCIQNMHRSWPGSATYTTMMFEKQESYLAG
ncbi:hypothetical protein PMZ80_009819 [Knufia obscura]|uniref:Uncharacterized protein n=2 Tax=Knufia TaxID=430999 RepID=A0AAN8I9S0_9EURO|nr:hypothetical protein PMZ80_009819 [Knufia obscura]KAK5955911.1 hypothetical protein OHC33_002484 [Knufia fluminis]